MNNEQKQRAIKLITYWRDRSITTMPEEHFVSGDCMTDLLQELIDAPEPEPVGYTNETELDYVRKYEALPVSGTFWPTSDEDACVALYTAPPANNQSEQHLEMVNAPAPSVPDEQLQAAFDRGLKAGNEQSVAQQIEIHKLHDSLAAPQPEQPTDLVRDAERWLSEHDLELLVTFGMQADDCDADGHTLSKEQTRRLCELGVLRHVGFGRHEMTAFGGVLFDQHWEQSRSLPLRTHTEYAALAAEKGGA